MIGQRRLGWVIMQTALQPHWTSNQRCCAAAHSDMTQSSSRRDNVSHTDKILVNCSLEAALVLSGKVWAHDFRMAVYNLHKKSELMPVRRHRGQANAVKMGCSAGKAVVVFETRIQPGCRRSTAPPLGRMPARSYLRFQAAASPRVVGVRRQALLQGSNRNSTTPTARTARQPAQPGRVL
jgi:hypothetical protein